MMKNSTKFKIIKWVEKILKYQQPVQLPLKEEKRQIIEVRWEGKLPAYHANFNLNEVACEFIGRELEKLKIVDIKVDDLETRKDHYKVSARAFFIEPIER